MPSRPLSALLSSHAAQLDRFAGAAAVPVGAPFWEALLALPVPLSQYPPAEVELALQPVCASLVAHNSQTHHLQKLLLFTAQLVLLSAAQEAAPAAAASCGSRLVAVLLKFAAEHLTADKLTALLAEPSSAALGAPTGGALAHFVSTALEYLAAGPVTDATFVLHWEVSCALQASLATQVTRAAPHAPVEHPASAAAATHGQAGRCAAALLSRVAERTPLSRGAVLQPYSAPARGLLRASLAPVSLLLGARPAPTLRSPATPLADAALLLLGPLLHWPGSPYRPSLGALGDGPRGGDAEAGPSSHSVAFPVLLDALALALARGMEAVETPGAMGGAAAEGCADAAVLLLHTLLLHSSACTDALLGDASLAPRLLFQLLRRAHRVGAPPDGGRLLAALLLQLSALPPPFHAACASARAPGPPGPAERPLRGADLALGSLLVVELCRMATAAAPRTGTDSRPGDPFVLTAALAALINCAAYASQLSAAASARMVALASLMGRRASRAASSADASSLEGAATMALTALRDALVGSGGTPSPELVYAALRGREGLSTAQAGAPAGGARAAAAAAVAATLSWFSQRLDADESSGTAQHVAPVSPTRIWNAVDALERVAAHCQAFAAAPQAHAPAPATVFAFEGHTAAQGTLLPLAWAAAVTAQHPAPWHAPSLDLLLAPPA